MSDKQKLSVDLFSFADPNSLLSRAGDAYQRQSLTLHDSIKNGMIHTPAPNSTIHHVVTAAYPHPNRDIAEREGEFYMVAYVSIPLGWLEALDMEFATRWDVSFMGPAGTIQRLPQSYQDMEDLLGDRIYIGFDYMWLLESPKELKQPSHAKLKDLMVKFVTELRERTEESN